MRLLFVIPSFAIGGTNKVLAVVIKYLNNHGHDTDIFCLNHTESHDNFFNTQNILPQNKFVSYCVTSLKTIIFRRNFIGALISFFVCLTKTWGTFSLKKLVFSRAGIRLSSQKYDVVIGMEEGIATEFSTFITADSRIAWIHCDYSRYLAMAGQDELLLYSKFRHIVCVSNYTAEIFKSIYPDLSMRVSAIYNPIDVEGILKKSADSSDLIDISPKYRTSLITIVSIGRLDPVKRFHLIPRIASYLKSKAINFTWYIVGDGGEKQNILNEITKYCVENEVVLTGTSTNPYPLLSRAKLLVVLSESEACPNVLHEAMILHVPVISTDYPTAKEFIKNESDGIVVSIDKLSDAIVSTLQNERLLSRLRNNIVDYQRNNEIIEKMILGLFEGNKESVQ